LKATYRDVCSYRTGHAEAEQVEFNTIEVSYEDLVDVSWSIHNNPTIKNKQGWDIASQHVP
jgi:peptide-methionine (S)-S-oxide reductase